MKNTLCHCFMLCNLLPAGHACRKDELDGDGENKPPSENHAGDREPSPAQRPGNSQGRACRFANPFTDSEIVQKIDHGVPMSTRKTTQLSIKLWEDWRQHRLTTATCSSDPAEASATFASTTFIEPIQ